MNKFLIFGEARSGTTSLFRILESLYASEKHPRSPLAVSEPFHSSGLRRNYPKLYKKLKPNLKILQSQQGAKVEISDINIILDACYEFSFGIKHLWDHFSDIENWPFHGKEQNEFILEYARKNNIKIIFLSRNNFVLRLLSQSMADQSNIWNLDKGEEDINKLKNFKFKPVNLFDFHSELIRHLSIRSIYTKALESIDHYEISYEKLFKAYYSEYIPSEEELRNMKKQEIYNICEYLEIDENNLNKETVELYTSPQKRQTIKAYKKVPNIQEIIEYSKKQWDKDISWIMNE